MKRHKRSLRLAASSIPKDLPYAMQPVLNYRPSLLRVSCLSCHAGAANGTVDVWAHGMDDRSCFSVNNHCNNVDISACPRRESFTRNYSDTVASRCCYYSPIAWLVSVLMIVEILLFLSSIFDGSLLKYTTRLGGTMKGKTNDFA